MRIYSASISQKGTFKGKWEKKTLRAKREIQILGKEIPGGLFIYAGLAFLDINQHASLLR